MYRYPRHLTLSALALASVVLVVGALLYWQDARLAAATASDHLDTLQRAQRLVESQQTSDLGTRAELIASNQAVVGYVAQALGEVLPGTPVDRSSIVDILEERRGQLDLALAAVLDAEGQLVASTGRSADPLQFAAEPVFLAARSKQSLQSGLLIEGTRLLHIAILPLVAYASTDAYLVVALPVDETFAQTIAEVGATDVVLTMVTRKGPLIAGATLDAAQQSAVLPSLPARVGDDEPRRRLDFDGERHDASFTPLFGSQVAYLAALVSPYRDVSAFSAVRLPMIATGVLALLAVVLASSRLWTRVFGPAQQLALVVERAADAGDRQLVASEHGSPAIARLASAFNRLLPKL